MIITVIITVIITAIGVRNISRVHENVCILEAYLAGVDDTLKGELEYRPEKLIKRVKNKLNKGY